MYKYLDFINRIWSRSRRYFIYYIYHYLLNCIILFNLQCVLYTFNTKNTNDIRRKKIVIAMKKLVSKRKIHENIFLIKE